MTGDRPATHAALPATAYRFDGSVQALAREVPSEVPASVVIDGAPYAVMMVTPSDLVDFAWGFLLTEGVVPAGAIASIEEREDAGAFELRVALATGFSAKHRDRSVDGRTGCGACGIAALDDLPFAPVLQRPPVPIALRAVRRALLALEARQPLHEATRAVHAAAWARADGTLDEVREDVGRHNALDKLIGARVRAGAEPGDGFVVLTSRCSFELVEKAAFYGARAIVTVSAPTSLALKRARRHDMALLAIARHDGVMAFHGAERVVVPPPNGPSGPNEDPQGGEEAGWTSSGS